MPTIPPPPPADRDAPPLTVSQITARVKGVLEDSLPYCWVTGELSDYRKPSTGHCYFSLQDESSQLSCVMFRFYAQQLRFEPEPGMQVLIYGNVSVYERGGRYQFYTYRIQPAGVGEMALAFEQLKSRLADEGLFDADGFYRTGDVGYVDADGLFDVVDRVKEARPP